VQVVEEGEVRVHSRPWVTPEDSEAQAVDIACEMACVRSGPATVLQDRLPPKSTQTVHDTEDSAAVT
jgi:hypothetical protein